MKLYYAPGTCALAAGSPSNGQTPTTKSKKSITPPPNTKK